MFTAEESWKMTEPDKVAALIREIGCWRLGNWDGCCCSNFSIRNVDVHISCGKGGPREVVISSGSMDYMDWETKKTDPKRMQPIMDEVIRQVSEQSGRDGKFAEIIIID